MSARAGHDAPEDDPAGQMTRLRGMVLGHARTVLDSVGPALGTLFFIPHPLIGLLVWGAFALNPHYALFALLGLAVGEVMHRLLRTKDELHLGGDMRTNALLTAVAVGWMLTGAHPQLSALTQFVMAVAASAAAAVIAAVMERGLQKSVLPGLVWAYCIITGLLFMVFPVWTGTAVLQGIHVWPAAEQVAAFSIADWGGLFLSSLGMLLFSPGGVAGGVVAAVTLLWSRTMFVCGLVGWICGVATAVAFNDLGQAFAWAPAAYNFYLAGVALGAVFFLPGRAALLMAALAGVAASFFALVLQHVMPGAVAYLPVSALVTVWLGIAALARPGGKSVLWRNHTPWLKPEEAWWRAAHWYSRFGRDEPLFALPVAAPLLIAQGFDGTLSHAGAWRHALDFQSPEEVPEGDAIWEAPVLAPASGTVERVRANVPDNELGVSNYAENWGNHIVLRLDQGGYALLAHLRQNTIAVNTGARVETGAFLANVGNSGRSPVPHLHLQAQNDPEPGAPTAPFRIANYLSERTVESGLTHWHDADVPLEGDIVMAAPSNPPVHELLASLAPGRGVWMVETDGAVPAAFRERAEAGSVRMSTMLDEAGRHILAVQKGGSLVTRLAPDAWRMIVPQGVSAPLLRLLSLGASSVPYAAFKGLTWDDTAPLMPFTDGGILTMPVLPYRRMPFVHVRCACKVAPGDARHDLEVETRVETPPFSLPHRLVCKFELLRGPVRVTAEFRDGSVKYEQMSFEPGLPFGAGSA